MVFTYLVSESYRVCYEGEGYCWADQAFAAPVNVDAVIDFVAVDFLTVDNDAVFLEDDVVELEFVGHLLLHLSG